MTTELFMQWKTKKMEEREASLATQRAERAKNDRMRYYLPAGCSVLKIFRSEERRVGKEC